MKHDVAGSETSGVDVADLRAFCMVVDLASITEAARSLGESKGSVSRRLSRLERALRVLTEDLLDFDAHQIDIALRAASALQDSSLVAHRLEDVSAGLFAAPEYLERHGTPKRLEDLHDHRMLLFNATRGMATLTAQTKASDKPCRVRVRAAISASDFSFAREVALAGAGIAVLPLVIVQRDVTEGRLVRVLRAYALLRAAVYLVHTGARFLPPKVKAFRDFVVDAFRERTGERRVTPLTPR
jgi:DNA-binding transcriptional LysR family regulator